MHVGPTFLMFILHVVRHCAKVVQADREGMHDGTRALIDTRKGRIRRIVNGTIPVCHNLQL